MKSGKSTMIKEDRPMKAKIFSLEEARRKRRPGPLPPLPPANVMAVKKAA